MIPHRGQYCPPASAWLGGSFNLAEGVDGRFSYVKASELDEVHSIARDTAGNLWVTVWNYRGGGVLRPYDEPPL